MADVRVYSMCLEIGNFVVFPPETGGALVLFCIRSSCRRKSRIIIFSISEALLNNADDVDVDDYIRCK